MLFNLQSLLYNNYRCCSIYNLKIEQLLKNENSIVFLNNGPKGGQSSQNSLPVNDDSFYPGQRPTGATPGLQPTCPKNICHLVIFASQPTLYRMCHWMKM